MKKQIIAKQLTKIARNLIANTYGDDEFQKFEYFFYKKLKDDIQKKKNVLQRCKRIKVDDANWKIDASLRDVKKELQNILGYYKNSVPAVLGKFDRDVVFEYKRDIKDIEDKCRTFVEQIDSSINNVMNCMAYVDNFMDTLKNKLSQIK